MLVSLGLFLILISIFLVFSSNLLISLILLEMLGFFVFYFVALGVFTGSSLDFILLGLFSVFVMEGVIALSGMISLVSFTGSDYVSSSSLLKC